MRAIGEKLLFEFSQHFFRRAGSLRKRLREQFCQELRFYVREHRLLFDVLEIFRQQIHDMMTKLAKLACVHSASSVSV